MSNDGLRTLVVEQYRGAAVALAGDMLVMVNGRIVDRLEPHVVEADAELKRRYLGVTA